MEKVLLELSVKEFETLVEHTIDRRLEVWFAPLVDTWADAHEEKGAKFQTEFAASLRRALEQARLGEGVDLGTFREQIGR